MSDLRKNSIIKNRKNQTLSEVFPRFVASQTAKGVSDKTIQTYYSHLQCIGKHIDLSLTFTELQKEDIEDMIVSMRESGLAHNSINSYMRVFRTFFHWCQEEGLTELEIPRMKDVETVKPTYSDAELLLLLKKPDKKANFCEYRNWVIVNFFLNCGCRAGTVRQIRNEDVNLEMRQVIFRHTKTGKLQSIPLCERMVAILKEYMKVRRGEDEDYLFCNEFGQELTEGALRSAIADYNLRRGVEKTSLHLFRHTFARKYLVDCGGDAFRLQKLLGHSTLAMTKHYCAIYDRDISKNFDRFSPLAQMNTEREKIRKRA